MVGFVCEWCGLNGRSRPGGRPAILHPECGEARRALRRFQGAAARARVPSGVAAWDRKQEIVALAWEVSKLKPGVARPGGGE